MKKLILLLMVGVLASCGASVTVEEELPQAEVIEPDVVEEEPLLIESETIEEVAPFSEEVDVASLGRIGVLSNSMNINRDYPFLDGLNATVYNQYELFDETKYDTLVILYQQNQVNFYPPTNWGVSRISIGELLLREVRGKRLIMAHFESFEEATSLLNTLDIRLFTLTNDSTLDEFTRWQTLNPFDVSSSAPWNAEAMLGPVTLSDPSRLKPLDVCRLETNLRHQDGSRRGFPYAPHKTKAMGTVRVAMIPLDFPSYPGDPASIERIHEDLLEAVTWSQTISGGKMTYEFVFVDEWLTLPYDQDYYPVYGVDAFSAERQSWQEGMDQAFLVADPYVDFSTIDFVYFYFPYESVLNQQTSLYGVVNTTTPTTQIRNLDVFGLFQPINYEGDQYWTHFVHEILHSQGFVGHGPCMYCPYSIMMDDWGYAKGILTWEGFLADWYDETQLNCIDRDSLEEPFVFELDSIDTLISEPGDSNLMIKLSPTKIMVIEYRSTGRYSTLPPEFQGIFIYVMDMEKGSQYPQNSRLPQLDNDATNHWYVIYPENANFAGFAPYPFVHSVNQEVTYDGIQIRVLRPNVIEVSQPK